MASLPNQNLELPPTVSSRTVTQAVADLQTVSFWQGVGRFSLLGSIVLSCMALAWATPLNSLFWVGTIVAGIFYALWLFCTHDAAHHTLLGRPVLEEILARLISWPILWPVGVYSELHRLHHGWNGLDLRDPERYQPSEREYQQAPPWIRWYMRHQWIIHIFVLGGLGIIVKTVMDGRRFQNRLPRLKWQLLLDSLGMLAIHTCLITVVIITHASLLRYLLFWVCLERVVGGIAQVRAHLEHYGLWHPMGNHQLTQLYASRNLHTSAWFSWLIGGLNYHGVHHGFPNIPFDQLPEAHQRVQRILDDHGLPSMNMEPGYFRAINRLINSISLIPNL